MRCLQIRENKPKPLKASMFQMIVILSDQAHASSGNETEIDVSRN